MLKNAAAWIDMCQSAIISLCLSVAAPDEGQPV
jgi:hypothetical protein